MGGEITIPIISVDIISINWVDGWMTIKNPRLYLGFFILY
jgi:hypothetical protein